jgi:predicted transcriptional regulator
MIRDNTMVSKLSLFFAISDKKASNIFKSIASADSNTDILISQLKLTRKQYYSRMSLLLQAGLVKRQKGRYLLTAFGKVIYSAQMNLEAKIENALDNYWKLKAIDSLEMPSREETGKVISALIENEEIKSILMKEESRLSAEVEIKKTRDVRDTLLTVPNY